MGGKGSAPPAPDYTGAAVAQSEASKEIATQQNWANRPTQNTPWGSTSWSAVAGKDPSTGQDITQWTQNQTLDPTLKAALDDQLAIQAGRSDLAGSFMGRVASDYSQPFNWAGMPGTAATPQQQYTYGRNLQSYIPSYNLDTSAPQQLTSGYERLSPIGQQTGVQGYNYDTSAPAQTTQTTNAANFTDERKRIEDQLFARMQPEHDRQTAQLQTQLANQGLTPGSQAYNMELQRLSDQQARERYNAVEQGGAEQQRLQSMLMGQQQQAFGQDLSSQQAQNAALAQQFGQGLQQGQFTNQALQNIFGQQQQAGMFGLGAQQQAFGQDLASQQAYNQSLAAQQGMQQSAGNFYNQAQQQMFGQDQARNQQNFAQMMQAAQYQNQLRQQAISEEAMRRGMSLNELNALLTGQQVGTPQMPSFMGAAAGQAPQYMQAAQNQYQAGLDQFNAEQQGSQGMMSGLFSLGGAALTVF